MPPISSTEQSALYDMLPDLKLKFSLVLPASDLPTNMSVY